MKRLFSPMSLLMTAFLAVFMTCAFAFAQVIDIPNPPTTTGDVIAALGALLGGAKGATTLVIVGLAGQFLAAFVLSPLWDSLKLDVKYKFLVFALATLIGAIVPLMMQGQTFVQALSSGGVLLLVVQYGHRIYELFLENKDA